MDECTVHVSQEFLTLHVETHAHIRLVFVPPNATAVCQPLDRAYTRPLKAALGRHPARHVGREIQHHPDDIANITHSIAGLRSLFMHWTQKRGAGYRQDGSQHSSLVRHRLLARRPG